MTARDDLHEAICCGGCGVARRCTRTDQLIDSFASELVDRARRGVTVMEESLGAYQCAKDVREILDVVDPTTPDPDGWDF